MKILHINTYDITGGAARAAYRLHKGMLKSNIDSLMLVNNQHVYDEDILELSPLSKTYEVFDQISSYISNQFFQKYYRPKSDFSIIRKLPTNLPNVVKKINPDIIHLHWINEQFINLDELSQLNKPVIWTLHDMWAMTGGCHYNGNCFAYLDKCGKCPILKSSKVKDLSYRQFQDKLNSYAKINNFCINGVSSWIANEAKKSSLLRFNQIVNLPNTLDVSIYKPFNSSFSRSTLQLSLEKKIVLLGASYSTSDDRKGFHLLVQALQMLPNKNNIQILISGNAIKENFFSGFEVKFIGYVNDDYTLALLYSAAALKKREFIKHSSRGAILWDTSSLFCNWWQF
jgi:glycosyltransferase involved in cell wall biosynthesis